MTDPTPDVPVFRLVRETTELPAAERYRLAVACGLVEPFVPAEKVGAN